MKYEYTLAFQALLYRRPLFEFIGKSERNMNILVLGWNEAAEAFVDQCLQAGQMDKHELHMMILSDHAEQAMEKYLSDRPDLKRFVNVNGSLSGQNVEIYADLNFKEFSQNNLEETELENSLLDILAEAPDEKYHYFMVAFEDDGLKQKVANALKNTVNELIPEETNAIHYVTTQKENSENGIFPICIRGFQTTADIDPELERMAYNAHLTWEDSINGDAVAELQKFRADKYNYLSSVALALSIRYKLADLDIDYEECQTAAEEFWNKLQDNEAKETLNRIIALEHRRWVLHMCCAGWTAPPEELRQKYYDDCILRCSVKDKENKIHPCIVRSSVETPLSTGIFSQDKNLWDQKSENEEALDELDRMSLELHRRMAVKAKKYMQENPLDSGEILEIREYLKNPRISDKLKREWERFVFCLKNIFDGNWAYSKQYDRYKEMFLETVQAEGEECLNFINERVSILSKKIWPVIEKNFYRDYKMNDEILVRKIPFILTYRIGLSLAMAFRTTTSLTAMNDTMFKNVASATVIKPGKLTYLLYLDENSQKEVIRHMIQIVVKYMRGKGINCEITFLITGRKDVQKEKESSWRKCFDRLMQNGYIKDYKFGLTETEREALEFWNETLAEHRPDLFDGTTNLFQSMQANGELLKMIQDRYAYFEFDSRSKQFRNNQNCRFLSYIEDHTYLGIEEMFGLVGAADMEFHYPVLGSEYKKLWNIYIGRNRGNKIKWKENVRNSVKNWNIMCDTLKNYEEVYCSKDYVDMRLLEKSYTGYRRWSDIQKILYELLGETGGKQYLLPEKENGQIVRFRYLNQDIKSVLTKAGEILEIYTYFKVCEQGWFDEVACGYCFRWEDEKISNELDLVLTKGFQSLIVECKARSKLDQNFYFKLNSLVDMFGIGAHKILLTTAKTDDGDNRMQQERGNMMGITTISDIQDIEEIAEKFKELV